MEYVILIPTSNTTNESCHVYFQTNHYKWSMSFWFHTHQYKWAWSCQSPQKPVILTNISTNGVCHVDPNKQFVHLSPRHLCSQTEISTIKTTIAVGPEKNVFITTIEKPPHRLFLYVLNFFFTNMIDNIERKKVIRNNCIHIRIIQQDGYQYKIVSPAQNEIFIYFWWRKTVASLKKYLVMV